MVSTISRKDQNNNDDLNQPSKEGRFGKYGGQYVPETQASKMSGNDPNDSRHCLFASSPITA